MKSMETDYPWWGYLYFGVLLAATAYGAKEEKSRPFGRLMITAEVVSLGLMALCIAAFVNPTVAVSLGNALIVVVVCGTLFEFFSAVRTLNYVPYDPEFSHRENEGLRFFGMVVGALVVLPGYVLGALAWFRAASA